MVDAVDKTEANISLPNLNPRHQLELLLFLSISHES